MDTLDKGDSSIGVLRAAGFSRGNNPVNAETDIVVLNLRGECRRSESAQLTKELAKVRIRLTDIRDDAALLTFTYMQLQLEELSAKLQEAERELSRLRYERGVAVR